MSKQKLSKTEQRAAEACGWYAQNGGGEFSVEWNRSAMWGLCPRIDWRGERAAYASGCGYDKLSAVLCEFLYTLDPDGGLRGCGGAGLSTVQDRLETVGWVLIQTFNGRTEDGFRLRRLTDADKGHKRWCAVRETPGVACTCR